MKQKLKTKLIEYDNLSNIDFEKIFNNLKPFDDVFLIVKLKRKIKLKLFYTQDETSGRYRLYETTGKLGFTSLSGFTTKKEMSDMLKRKLIL